MSIGCNRFKKSLLGAKPETLYMPTHKKNAQIFKCKILKSYRQDGKPRYRVNLPKELMELDVAKRTHFYATVEIDTVWLEATFSVRSNGERRET